MTTSIYLSSFLQQYELSVEKTDWLIHLPSEYYKEIIEHFDFSQLSINNIYNLAEKPSELLSLLDMETWDFSLKNLNKPESFYINLKNEKNEFIYFFFFKKNDVLDVIRNNYPIFIPTSHLKKPCASIRWGNRCLLQICTDIKPDSECLLYPIEFFLLKNQFTQVKKLLDLGVSFSMHNPDLWNICVQSFWENFHVQENKTPGFFYVSSCIWKNLIEIDPQRSLQILHLFQKKFNVNYEHIFDQNILTPKKQKKNKNNSLIVEQVQQDIDKKDYFSAFMILLKNNQINEARQLYDQYHQDKDPLFLKKLVKEVFSSSMYIHKQNIALLISLGLRGDTVSPDKHQLPLLFFFFKKYQFIRMSINNRFFIFKQLLNHSSSFDYLEKNEDQQHFLSFISHFSEISTSEFMQYTNYCLKKNIPCHSSLTMNTSEKQQVFLNIYDQYTKKKLVEHISLSEYQNKSKSKI